MKYKIFLGLWLVSVGMAGAAAYPLACRGGEQMSIHWHRGSWPAPDRAYFTFFKTARGHNHTPVGPGNCAWLDRRVRHNEPGRVCLENVGIRSFVYELSGEHLATNYDTTSAKRNVLMSKLWSGNTFKIMVENDGRGCLRYVSTLPN